MGFPSPSPFLWRCSKAVSDHSIKDPKVRNCDFVGRERCRESLNLSIQPLFYIERKSLMISAAAAADVSVDQNEAGSVRPSGFRPKDARTDGRTDGRGRSAHLPVWSGFQLSCARARARGTIEASRVVVISDPCLAGSSPLAFSLSLSFFLLGPVHVSSSHFSNPRFSLVS